MALYSEEIIDEVRNRNDIVDVISKYVSLKRKGRNYFGCCPFHNEKTPSFSVSPDRQIYHCFGCGQGGNVISFIMKIEELNFKEAVELLANNAHIDLPKNTISQYEEQQEKLKATLYKINKLAAEFYHNRLYQKDAKIAQDYVKKRQLNNASLKAFMIGYSSMRNELTDNRECHWIIVGG